MSDQIDDKIAEAFGEKYKPAHLSKLDFSEEINKKILQWSKKPAGFLVFSGSVGIGKTYMCAAIARELLEKKANIRMYREGKFFSHLRYIMFEKKWDYEIEIQKLSDCDCFILDDMGSSQMTDWQKECLFYLVDYSYVNQKKLILTSNLFLPDMEKIYNQRFVSRLGDAKNVVIQLAGTDRRKTEQV